MKASEYINEAKRMLHDQKYKYFVNRIYILVSKAEDGDEVAIKILREFMETGLLKEASER